MADAIRHCVSRVGFSLTDAEVERLRVIEAAARELERANDEALGAFRPRPDIAWRNLKAALRPTAARNEEK